MTDYTLTPSMELALKDSYRCYIQNINYGNRINRNPAITKQTVDALVTRGYLTAKSNPPISSYGRRWYSDHQISAKGITYCQERWPDFSATVADLKKEEKVASEGLEAGVALLENVILPAIRTAYPTALFKAHRADPTGRYRTIINFIDTPFSLYIMLTDKQVIEATVRGNVRRFDAAGHTGQDRLKRIVNTLEAIQAIIDSVIQHQVLIDK